MPAKTSIRPADRADALALKQTLKMARSAHAYVRGSTVQFYQWLEAQKRGTLPEGPAVWICGDCHAGNLGPVAGMAVAANPDRGPLGKGSSLLRLQPLIELDGAAAHIG